LYFLDIKIHSFDFPKCHGVAIIPENFLEKDGIYRVAVNFSIEEFIGKSGRNSTYLATFIVQKGG